MQNYKCSICKFVRHIYVEDFYMYKFWANFSFHFALGYPANDRQTLIERKCTDFAINFLQSVAWRISVSPKYVGRARL